MQFDAFMIFWCAMVIIMTVVNVAWAINDLKQGSARFGWGWWGQGERVNRDDEPFEFWLAVGSKFAALPVGLFMLWFASGMFWNQP